MRAGTEGRLAPSKAQGTSLRDALALFVVKGSKLHTSQVASLLTEAYGHIGCKTLTARHLEWIEAWLARYENPFSRHRRTGAVRRVLRHLSEAHGAPPLHRSLRTAKQPKPRNVTATAEECEALIAAAAPWLRCWMLLCRDTAVRSGTAARLGPSEYDKAAGLLTFTTKYDNAQRLPVTAELAALLNRCTDPTRTFCSQLHPRGAACGYSVLKRAYADLKLRVGITRKLTLHDLRRTQARRVYSITHDLRVVQALLGHSDLAHTAWYLQDATTEIPLAVLELAKLKPTTEVTQ